MLDCYLFFFFFLRSCLPVLRHISQVLLCTWTSSSKTPPKCSNMDLSPVVSVQQHFQLCFSSLWCLALLFSFSCSSSTHRAHLELCSCHPCCVTACSAESQPAQHFCAFLQYFCRSAPGHIPISQYSERCCRNTEFLELEGTLQTI